MIVNHAKGDLCAANHATAATSGPSLI
jgi:hypothetical protein